MVAKYESIYTNRVHPKSHVNPIRSVKGGGTSEMPMINVTMITLSAQLLAVSNNRKVKDRAVEMAAEDSDKGEAAGGREIILRTAAVQGMSPVVMLLRKKTMRESSTITEADPTSVANVGR